MTAVHDATTAAQTRSRDRTVPRQSGAGRRRDGAGRMPLSHSMADLTDPTPAVMPIWRVLPRRDDRFFRRRRRSDPLDHDRLASRRRDEVPLLGRDLLYALRRPQRLDLEAQMTVHFLLGGALLLHALDLIAVAQQLEVLPRGEEQHHHQEEPDPGRAPQLLLPRLVHLADDRVVANVLLDRVLEVHRAHANLSIARSFALRARGVRSTSASGAESGRLVTMPSCSSAFAMARNVCLTMRSSSERDVITASRGPAH